MIAIRGATTVSEDTAEEVREAVFELLQKIRQENDFLKDNVVCIFFSTTADISSFYPAKVAREAGYSTCALYSSLEPSVCGALDHCIRVLMLLETDIKPKHIYLRGASVLRKDLTQKYNIALDGPAGSGKSTISKILSKDFGILYLDTGAMYRACALRCILNNVDLSDEEQVSECVKNGDIAVKYEDGQQKIYLDGQDVTVSIRTPEVSNGSSKVAVFSAVRQKMVELQREIASKTSCILDGRDIGTIVLPNAEFKFFLTASPEVRAKRRYEENSARGFKVDFATILSEIHERDIRDSSRAVSPLKKADDAILIDTTEMTTQEVVDFIKKKIQEKI